MWGIMLRKPSIGHRPRSHLEQQQSNQQPNENNARGLALYETKTHEPVSNILMNYGTET